jgi:ABC-type transport system involved in cytochrome bd biosynthesis fused ATPase/permease subunit
VARTLQFFHASRYTWSSAKKYDAFLKEKQPMLLTIALILFVLWALGFFAFHFAGGLIHLILIIAVIVIVLHFVRGGRRVV